MTRKQFRLAVKRAERELGLILRRGVVVYSPRLDQLTYCTTLYELDMRVNVLGWEILGEL